MSKAFSKLGCQLICDPSSCYNPCMKGDDGAGEVVDVDAINLSHVGNAAYDTLRKEMGWYHHQLWDVTVGKVLGNLHQTPREAFPPLKAYENIKDGSKNDDPISQDRSMMFRTTDLPDGHDDWLPERICEIMSETQVWCDLTSLSPPTGLFLDKIKDALKRIAETGKTKKEPIVVRMLFGNLPGMPVNCNKLLKDLCEGISKDANIRVWVGAWRRGTSWNHSKIIAIDGRHLWTGGHNLWDQHYLRKDPVHDLSLELEGKVTICGHRYANEQWDFIRANQSTLVGLIIDKIPDWLPMTIQTRVTVSEFPRGKAATFPPLFNTRLIEYYGNIDGSVPIITIGRYGAILKRDRPSDNAILAMFDSAQTIIRLAIQDLGPVCVPGTKTPLPGLTWPRDYLKVFARVIWTRGVDVEIILSNPKSIPDNLSPLEACYGNGWNCVDVAAEIIKQIRKQFPDVSDGKLRKTVEDNLRISFIREHQGNKYESGQGMGMHAKHFIVDDVLTYIGSQNLYKCDLAEWGVAIDDKNATEQIMNEYWHPMWKCSYKKEDCDVQAVMDGLSIERDPEEEGAKIGADAALAQTSLPGDQVYFDRDLSEKPQEQAKK